MTSLKWGLYTFPTTPAIRMRAERIGQSGGSYQGIKRVWDLDGFISANTGNVKTQMDALVTAFASDGHNLTLYANDGVTVLDQLATASALHGTIVRTPPEFPQGEHAEFARVRHYHIAVEAEYVAGGATYWGKKNRDVSYQPDGTCSITVAGEYAGSTLGNAQAAANAAKESGANIRVVSERQTSDSDVKTCAFQYQYIDTDLSREVISFSETITIKSAGNRLVAQEILDGGAAVIQETTITPAEAWQRGQAVGRTGYPAFPGSAVVSGLAEGSTTEQLSPQRLKSGLTVYPITWSRHFIFAETPARPAPGVPPE